MVDFYDLAEKKGMAEICALYPISEDFFENMNLSQLNAEIPLADALEKCDPEWLEELGTDVDDVLEQFCEFMEALTSPEDDALQIRQITICGGRDKSGQPENAELSVHPGDVISIVGPTGSGKTTVMSWLLSMVPDNRRLITIEEGSREFDLVKRDADGKILNSVVHLLTRPHENPALDIDQDILLERVLRKHPDVIGVGEMRSAKEALSVAESSRTGHTVVTTIHSNSAEATYRRMMTLAKRKYNMADDILMQIMVEAYPVVIFTKQLEDGSRKIMQIIEGEDYTDGKLQYRTLYQYNVEDNRTIAGKTQVFGEHKKLNPFTDNLKKRLLDNGISQLELKKLMDERREP